MCANNKESLILAIAINISFIQANGLNYGLLYQLKNSRVSIFKVRLIYHNSGPIRDHILTHRELQSDDHIHIYTIRLKAY